MQVKRLLVMRGLYRPYRLAVPGQRDVGQAIAQAELGFIRAGFKVAAGTADADRGSRGLYTLVALAEY